MYYAALAILLILHLLAINLAAAGPLVSLLLRCSRPNTQSDPSRSVMQHIAKEIADHTLAAFWAGAALGAALLWLLHVNDDPFYEAVVRFPAARLWFAVGELAFYAFCQGAYCWLLRRDETVASSRSSLRGVLLILLPALAATNLLYHFPALLVAMVTLAEQPAIAPAVVDGAAFRGLLVEPQIATRALHHVLAAIALAGVYGAMVAWHSMRRAAVSDAGVVDSHHNDDRRAAVLCGRLALGATLFQIPMGIAVLLNFDRAESLMGREPIASALFVASMLFALWLLAKLGALALGDVSRATVLGSAALLVATVGLMVGAMVRTRAVDRGAQVQIGAPSDARNRVATSSRHSFSEQ
jgi:hypothetical protein